VKTIPGVREAIEQGQWSDADREIGRAAAAIERAATQVSGLATTLGGG
jgi:N-acetylated-alpha-linked acidic dipeptidase